MSGRVEDADPLSFAEARRRIAALVEPIADVETVPLAATLARVLSRDLVARHPVPPHDNSAMDGYALRAIDAAAPLRLVGRSRAGEPFPGRVEPGECVRILTGAVLPAGCDAVVPQERVAVDHGVVRVDGVVTRGQHVRLAGEDVAAGAVALAAGRRMNPSDLGVAASIGEGTLVVGRRPRVAVFSTGNELRDVDEVDDARDDARDEAHDDPHDDPGSIRDANRYTIIAMLARLGVETIDLGIVRDDPDALEATLTHACSEAVRADAVITSGGVSAGDADYTRDVMRRAGEVSFWTLAFKPGRPMAFGTVRCGARSALLFALPGNPVAVMVVFYALVRDALLAMMGAKVAPIPVVDAVCDTPLAKLAGRTEFVRGIALRRDGGWHVRPTDAQGSGILRSMSEANCLVVLDHDRGPVAAGDVVGTWLFDAFV